MKLNPRHFIKGLIFSEEDACIHNKLIVLEVPPTAMMYAYSASKAVLHTITIWVKLKEGKATCLILRRLALKIRKWQ